MQLFWRPCSSKMLVKLPQDLRNWVSMPRREVLSAYTSRCSFPSNSMSRDSRAETSGVSASSRSCVSNWYHSESSWCSFACLMGSLRTSPEGTAKCSSKPGECFFFETPLPVVSAPRLILGERLTRKLCQMLQGSFSSPVGEHEGVSVAVGDSIVAWAVRLLLMNALSSKFALS